MKISVITPSVRPEMLEIVKRCLNRQTFKDFEWLIVGPDSISKDIWLLLDDDRFNFIQEPQKQKGDYYNLNKAWNKAFLEAKGELIVSIVDGLWFEPDLLDKLWTHYEVNPKAIISGIGHQYDRIENGKPEHMVWQDLRINFSEKFFFETEPNHIELCVASIPMKAICDVKGFKEIYDIGAALSEKEMCVRMGKRGYKFYIDKSLEYRAIRHKRLGGEENWNKHYQIAVELFNKHIQEINNGQGLQGDLCLQENIQEPRNIEKLSVKQ